MSRKKKQEEGISVIYKRKSKEGALGNLEKKVLQKELGEIYEGREKDKGKNNR